MSDTSEKTQRPELAAFISAARADVRGTGARFKQLVAECLCCWGFFTRIALPQRWTAGYKALPLAQAVRAFPLAGLGIGLIGGGILMLASTIGLHPLASALIALAAVAGLTGALHEDGLADVADGFGGGATREEKLDIMRDSRIGTYGVMALIFAVGLKAALLSSLMGAGSAALALATAHVVSRGLLPWVMIYIAPARDEGLGADAGRPNNDDTLTATFLSMLFAVLLLGAWTGILAVVLALSLATVALGAVAFIAKRQIGGYTGDVLGAAQQMAEIAVLLAIVIVSV